MNDWHSDYNGHGMSFLNWQMQCIWFAQCRRFCVSVWHIAIKLNWFEPILYVSVSFIRVSYAVSFFLTVIQFYGFVLINSEEKKYILSFLCTEFHFFLCSNKEKCSDFLSMKSACTFLTFLWLVSRHLCSKS